MKLLLDYFRVTLLIRLSINMTTMINLSSHIIFCHPRSLYLNNDNLSKKRMCIGQISCLIKIKREEFRM